MYTVGSQKLFTSEPFEIHSLDASNVANVQVHVVPASGGSRNGIVNHQDYEIGYFDNRHIFL